MTERPSDTAAPPQPRSVGRKLVADRRDDRRKAALKANMARRKAQTRGRKQDGDPAADGETAASGNDPEPETRNE